MRSTLPADLSDGIAVAPRGFSGGYAKLVAGAIMSTPTPTEDLVIAVENQLRFIEDTRARNRTFLGRLYNALTGEQPHVVTVPGTQLFQMFDIAQLEPPFQIEADKQYRVSPITLGYMLERMKAAVSDKSDG